MRILSDRDPRLATLILAAGKGTRMKSAAAKVLAPVAGKPLLAHVLDQIRDFGCARVVPIIGYDRDAVRAAFAGEGLEFAVQEDQLGTGHAVLSAAPALGDFEGDLLILSGDMPLVRTETLRLLLARHRERGAALTLLTACPDDPTGLGRIIRTEGGDVREIVEEKDIDRDEVRAVREINVGVYVADAGALLDALRAVGNDNAQGEYYLPDAVKVLRERGRRVEAWDGATPEEGLGVNSPRELARAGVELRRRAVEALMDAGVRILDPASTYIEADVTIGPGTVVQPFTFIGLGAVIGAEAVIGPFAHVPAGARVGDGEVKKA